MPQTFDISQAQQSSSQSSGSGPRSRGTGTPIDDFARTIFYISLVALAVMLGYMMWGLFGGAWANPAFGSMDKATQLRHLANIDILHTGLLIASIVAIVSLLICSFRDEGLGYVLGAAAAIFYAGLPYGTDAIYRAQNLNGSPASSAALTAMASLWWIYGGPAVLFVIVDMIRRLQAASENAAIQRANMKYGSNVGKQSSGTQKQRFLGRCWELPYCRDHVRTKCPVYIKRRGPCWWYKEGCMCEERIVLQAVIANDWKQQAAVAGERMHLTAAAPKSIMSPIEKRERCRKCVIYNEHQRQKYKVYVAGALVVVPAVLYLNLTYLQGAVQKVLTVAENATSRFNLAPGTPDTASLMHGSNAVMLQDILVGCIGLLIIAQVLKLVEFICFKLKI